ncbi:MAG: phage antirepressor N-terminal domain-containing protein [Sphingomonas sp.]
MNATAAALTFELVPFHGARILAARRADETDAGAVYVPMKRFCGELGLGWDGARRRIQRDSILREGAVMMTVPSEGGDQAQQTLPLNLIPGFLFGLDESRYAPELRERVQIWRRDCYAALFRHFFGRPPEGEGTAVMPAPSGPVAARIGAIRQAAEIADQLRREPVGPVRTFLGDALQEICAAIGMACPLIPLDPDVEPSPAERIDALLAGLATLDARGVRFNHLGRTRGEPRRIALNLPQLARLFAQHDIDVAVDDALRAALRTGTRHWRCRLETIPSRLSRRRRPTLCHVLVRSDG